MDFNSFIRNREITIDGAMSTALESLGYNTQSDLWTAAAIIDHPELIYKVHYDYLEAGADLIMTDTYQANIYAFEKHGYSKEEAEGFITRAVKIARQARKDYENQTGRHAYIAGTIGPYGAYLADGNEYRGDYELSEEDYRKFYEKKVQLILETGIDIIGVETQPKLKETMFLLNLIHEISPTTPIYVSYTLKDATHISDGTLLKRAVAAVTHDPAVVAVGINCTKLELVCPALRLMKCVSSKPLLVYPNTSASYDPQTKCWIKSSNKPQFENEIIKWYLAGAQLIGGCCTTLPAQIKTISNFIARMNYRLAN